MKNFKIRTRALTIILIFVLLAAGAYFLFTGLYAKTEARQYNIIVILKSTSPAMQYWQTVSAGVDSAAREFNVHADIEGTQDETDVNGQIQIIEKAIAAKPDAIVLAAADYNAVNPAAEEIREADQAHYH